MQRVFHHDASQLVLRWEVLYFSVAELTHECRLPGTIRTQNAVPAAAEKSEVRVREKEESAIRQREQRVTQ